MRTGIGYLRVSTKEQGVSGLGLEAQEAAVRALAVQHGVELVDLIREVASGRQDGRAGLAAVLARCRADGHALVAARLDRIGRRAATLIDLRDAGVSLLTGDLPSLDGPAAGLVLGVLAVVAQTEAETISARTRAALAAAKARGVKLGGRRSGGGLARGRATQQARARVWAESLRPVVEYLDRVAGAPLRTPQLAQALQVRGARTPRGGTRWSYAQTMRLRALLAA